MQILWPTSHVKESKQEAYELWNALLEQRSISLWTSYKIATNINAITKTYWAPSFQSSKDYCVQDTGDEMCGTVSIEGQ